MSMSTHHRISVQDEALPDARQRGQLLTVESRGIEPVAANERHGRPRDQLTLWFGSNITIGDFALGVLPVTLGLSWPLVLASVLVGNLLGALAVAVCSPMGPAAGLPQLILGRFTFGRLGSRLPAAFNYLSTLGWFAVNTILAAEGLRILVPGLPIWAASAVLVLIQAVLAVYGHDLIHGFERAMTVILGVLFLIVTIHALTRGGALSAYHVVHHGQWTAFAVMLSASFSYVASWAPYASDYSRYLPERTRTGRVLGSAFLGSFLASVWMELLGVAVAVLAGAGTSDPVAALHRVTGGFGDVAVLAIVLGGVAANALNAYSNALSAAALGVGGRRALLTAATCVLGFIIAVAGSGNFEGNYEDFLLMLGYWITPWLGVVVVDFYLRRGTARKRFSARKLSPFAWPALAAFVLAVLIELPFIDGPFYEGPIAKALGNVDTSYYVGFLAAAIIYLFAGRVLRARPEPATQPVSAPSPVLDPEGANLGA